MLIVDSQVHIWEDAQLGIHHRQTSTYSVDDLLKEMDSAGVSAAIVCPPASQFRGNYLAVKAHRAHPSRIGVMGWFPLDEPQARNRVAEWMSKPGMLGLRWALNRPEQKTWLTDGTMAWLWPLAERQGVPLAFIVNDNMKVIGEVARCYPKLKLMIDHIGRHSFTNDTEAFETLDDMLALAVHPNVAVKLSGAPSNSSDCYPWQNIHGYLKQIVEAFGPDRCFWGSDITRLQCTLAEAVTMFTEEMSWLKGNDLELVMGKGICNWLNWGITSNLEARSRQQRVI